MTLISQQATLLASNEAFKKQAESASEAAKKYMEENAELKKVSSVCLTLPCDILYGPQWPVEPISDTVVVGKAEKLGRQAEGQFSVGVCVRGVWGTGRWGCSCRFLTFTCYIQARFFSDKTDS